jgi:septal ring-binding cell division protein DamX
LQPDERIILSWNPEGFAVQLLGSYSLESVSTYMAAAAPLSLRYFQKTNNNRPWYAVVYGPFASKEEAAAEVNKLAEKLPVKQPWIRAVKSVQGEIQQARALR